MLPIYDNYAYKQSFGSKFNNTLTRALNSRKVDPLFAKNLTKMFEQDVFVKLDKSETLLGKNIFRIDNNLFCRLKDGENHIGLFEKAPKSQNKLKVYYEEVLAKFGSIEILKNPFWNKAQCISAGVSKKFKNTDKAAKYFKEVYLPEFKEMSVLRFNDIATDLLHMNLKGQKGAYKSYDLSNPSNIIKYGNYSITIAGDLVEKKEPNSLLNLLEGFVNPQKSGVDTNTLNKKELKMLRNIFKKCFMASEKAGLGFGKNSKFDEYKPYLDVIQLNKPFLQIFEETNTIKENCQSINVYMKKLDKYFDNLFGY